MTLSFANVCAFSHFAVQLEILQLHSVFFFKDERFYQNFYFSKKLKFILVYEENDDERELTLSILFRLLSLSNVGQVSSFFGQKYKHKCNTNINITKI